MTTPIDMMLDGVQWVESPPADNHDGLPYVTHSGVFAIAGLPSMRCYRLSDGRAVFHADDFNALLGDWFKP